MSSLMADFIESVRQPGSSIISAPSLAKKLGLQLQELAAIAGVHRNTVRLHPKSQKLQLTLRDVLRLVSVASELQADPDRLMFMLKNEPIPTFRHKTLLQLVGEGRVDDAIGYLESISSGYTG